MKIFIESLHKELLDVTIISGDLEYLYGKTIITYIVCIKKQKLYATCSVENINSFDEALNYVKSTLDIE